MSENIAYAPRTVHDIFAVKIGIYSNVRKTNFIFIFFCLIFALRQAAAS